MQAGHWRRPARAARASASSRLHSARGEMAASRWSRSAASATRAEEAPTLWQQRRLLAAAVVGVVIRVVRCCPEQETPTPPAMWCAQQNALMPCRSASAVFGDQIANETTEGKRRSCAAMSPPRAKGTLPRSAGLRCRDRGFSGSLFQAGELCEAAVREGREGRMRVGVRRGRLKQCAGCGLSSPPSTASVQPAKAM